MKNYGTCPICGKKLVGLHKKSCLKTNYFKWLKYENALLSIGLDGKGRVDVMEYAAIMSKIIGGENK